MPDAQATHWGNWIRARAQFVGFRSQIEMSEIIGCRREQICRWFMMEKPQLIMRKGFDKRLATVLQVDRHTLFTGYLNIKPESTPTTEQPSHSQPSDAARRRVLAIVELMSNDGLKELARVGEILLRSGNVMQIA